MSIIFLPLLEIENFLLKNCINGDLLITMGAGERCKNRGKPARNVVIHTIHMLMHISDVPGMWIFLCITYLT